MLVAAASAGFVAVATYVLAAEYRGRNFRSASLREARVALALAPADLDAERFDRLRGVYEQRSGADMVVLERGEIFSTSPSLDLTDVPAGLEPAGRGDDPAVVEATVDGHRALVVAQEGRSGGSFFFFFSQEQLDDSLSELARVGAAAWALTVVAAGGLGRRVARQTLRPIATTAAAAEAIASGQLDTRLPVAADDEFGALAGSFNHMADELEHLIAQLHEAAARERRFTAEVAHELRTPLTGISASATLLGEQIAELPGPLQRPMKLLVTDVDRLRTLVLQLLELSRLDAGAESVRLEPLRVADAIEAVIDGADLRRSASISVQADPSAVVLAEPSRLGRILGNLLDNAIRHGGDRIEVIARSHGDKVLIDVQDDGPGIAEPERDLVFERFFKSDDSRAAGGSGLGLAIARQQARAQGGDLVVDDSPNGGARFTLALRRTDLLQS